MDQNFISVVEFIEGISNSILSYALVLAAVGTITMALLELIKGVFQLRQLFHDRMLNWWISRIPDTDKDKVLDELLTFAGGGEAERGVLRSDIRRHQNGGRRNGLPCREQVRDTGYLGTGEHSGDVGPQMDDIV